MDKLQFKKFFSRMPKLPFRYIVEILESKEESDKETKVDNLIDPWVVINVDLPKIDIKSEVFKASRPIAYPFINFSNMELQLTMEENDQSVVSYFLEKCIMKRTRFLKNENYNENTGPEYTIYSNAVRRMLEKKEQKSGLTILVHELDETMSNSILTHKFDHCWLTSPSSYKWSYVSDSGVTYQLGFSFLSYSIEEEENLGEFATYLSEVNQAAQVKNNSLNSTKTQVFNEMESSNSGFVESLKNKYSYIDTTKHKVDKTVNDVSDELKTNKTIGSGKDSTIRGAGITASVKSYRTDVQLVYDKSINQMYLVDVQGNVLDSISKVYTSTKGDETNVGGETPTGDWVLDYTTSIKQKNETYKYKEENENAAALWAISTSESSDTLSEAKRARHKYTLWYYC